MAPLGLGRRDGGRRGVVLVAPGAAPLVKGAALFENVRQQREDALQIHEGVVRRLGEARLAVSRGDRALAERAIDAALASARDTVTGIISHRNPGAGAKRRRGRARRLE